MMQKKGNAVMNVIFGTILVVGVAIPIAQQVVDSANLTGIAGTVVTYIPVFLALGGLALAAALVSK